MEQQNLKLQSEYEKAKDAFQAMKASYEEVSNSHIWRSTKPICVALDKVKGFHRNRKEYGDLAEKEGATMRTQEADSVLSKSAKRNNRLGEPEPLISKDWIDSQKHKPLISIVIAAKRQAERAPYLRKALESLCAQCYQNLEVILVTDAVDRFFVQDISRYYSKRLSLKCIVLKYETQDRWAFWSDGVSVSEGSLIGFLEQEDALTPNCLAHVLEAYNESEPRNWELYLFPDAYLSEDREFLYEDWKDGAGGQPGNVEGLLRFGVFEKAHFLSERIAFNQWLLSLKHDQIFVSPWIGCYGMAIKDVWEDSQVRCIPFYLPQFHEIPENNKWWGDGFTEWVNVRKAKPLYEGHHQPRIPGELGYYDLGGEEGAEIQKKQIALAKGYGLAGFCYYYYWFDNGKCLLEMPLDRHLHDQTMDFPFCLCWANENWTRNWDGLQNEILMPQTYRPGWEEQFIIDILPYLKDERYIRVNGAPFLLIYRLQDIPNPAEAISTWRTVARQNGIDRLHISAVKWTMHAIELEISDYMLDSLTDFPPHMLCSATHHEEHRFRLANGQVKDYRKACAFHAEMPKQNYTYF